MVASGLFHQKEEMRWSFLDPSWSVREWASRGALGISIIHSFTSISFSATLFSDLGLGKGRGGGRLSMPESFSNQWEQMKLSPRLFQNFGTH